MSEPVQLHQSGSRFKSALPGWSLSDLGPSRETDRYGEREKEKESGRRCGTWCAGRAFGILEGNEKEKAISFSFMLVRGLLVLVGKKNDSIDTFTNCLESTRD